MTVFTIGHSTRPLEELVGLLQASKVDCLVDVRTVPRSRTNPQFNRDTLPDALAPHGIAYRHEAALGGLRKKQACSPNALWRNQSFRNYADYALSDEFRAALAELRRLADERTCAIMCAEAVWWRCHRRIIADYLLAAGETVRHIMGPDAVEDATLTPGAVIEAPDRIVYPAAQGSLGVD